MKKLKELTTRQEKFVLGWVSGLEKNAAYIEAGYSNKGTQASIDIAACRLSKLPHVKARYDELMGKLEEEVKETHIWKRQEAEERLLRLLNRAEKNFLESSKNVQAKACVDIIKELNTLNGIYETNEKEETNFTFAFVQPEQTLDEFQEEQEEQNEKEPKED